MSVKLRAWNEMSEGRIGVLLINLGTPDAPRPKAVKRYLSEFLTDERVIDLPWLFRQLLVKGVIIPKRYQNSAKLYSAIWTKEGSPLKVHGEKMTNLLQEALGEKFLARLSMRYGSPPIKKTLDTFKESRHLVILPLFPQYARATTGSIYREIFHTIRKWKRVPPLSFIDHYETDEGLIRAFCHSARKYDLSSYDHILFSYHGLPERQIRKADCYHYCLESDDCCQKRNEKNQMCYAAQCVATTRAICHTLEVPKQQMSHCYQSRLGKSPWLKPDTSERLRELAREGKKRVLVFCPSFVADCLETLYEIGIEYRGDFKRWGGETLDLVESLNTRCEWIQALKSLILTQVSHLQ